MKGENSKDIYTILIILIVKIFGAISTLLLASLITRSLSKSDAGSFFYIFSLIALLGVVSRLGSGQAILRYVTHAHHKSFQVRRSFHIGLIICAIGTSSSLLLLYAAQASEIGMPVLWGLNPLTLLLGIFALYAYSSQANFSQGLRGIGKTVVGTCFDNAIAISLALACYFVVTISKYEITIDTALSILFIAYIASTVLSSSLFYFYTRQDVQNARSKINIKEFMYFGASVYVVNLATILLNEYIVVASAYVLTQTQTAEMNVAFRLAKVLFLPLVIINIIVEPLIVKYSRSNKTELESYMRTLSTSAFYFVLIVFITFVVYGDSILELAFGNEYRDAHSALVILSSGFLVNVFTGPCSALLIMSGQQQVALKINLVTVALLVPSVHLAGSYFGINGIAVAFTAFMCIMNILMMIAAYKQTKVITYAHLNPLKFTSFRLYRMK